MCRTFSLSQSLPQRLPLMTQLAISSSKCRIYHHQVLTFMKVELYPLPNYVLKHPTDGKRQAASPSFGNSINRTSSLLNVVASTSNSQLLKTAIRITARKPPSMRLPHRSSFKHKPFDHPGDWRENIVPYPVLVLNTFHVEEKDRKDIEQKG